MADHPTEADLVRYLEGQLTARRATQIESQLAADTGLASVVEALRDALAMQTDLRDAVREAPGLETERRIERSLVHTVTSVIGGRETHKDTDGGPP